MYRWVTEESSFVGADDKGEFFDEGFKVAFFSEVGEDDDDGLCFNDSF